jgi:HEAT repeat protein
MRQLTELTEEPPTLRQVTEPAPTGPSLEELTASLGAADTTARAKAAHDLQAFGTAAIEPLCAALRDKEVRVRLAAAKSLGEVGDERAIQPLVAALRDLFPGRSPRRYRTVGILAAITFPIVSIAYGAVKLSEWGVPPTAIGVAFAIMIGLLLASGPVGRWLLLTLLGVPRPTDTSPCPVFSEALARIAERHPTPELREALPTLKEIAADSIQQNRRTRANSRKVVRRIEALTAQLEALPVTASAPVTDAEILPRASDGPA